MAPIKQRKIVYLVQVRNERKASEAAHIRRNLFQAARNASNARGDELSGFALVSWDRQGNMRTAINSGYGPIAWGRIPSECRDAFERHVTAELAQTSAPVSLDDGDDDHG